MSAYTTLNISSDAAEKLIYRKLDNLTWSQQERILDILFSDNLYKFNINCMEDGQDDKELKYLNN